MIPLWTTLKTTASGLKDFVKGTLLDDTGVPSSKRVFTMIGGLSLTFGYFAGLFWGLVAPDSITHAVEGLTGLGAVASTAENLQATATAGANQKARIEQPAVVHPDMRKATPQTRPVPAPAGALASCVR